MEHEELAGWGHDHKFDLGHELRGERRAWLVVALTAIAMLVEIFAGIAFNSMALLADGWHMGTHAAALTLAALAYLFRRRHADNPSFAFGTGKVGSLAGFASAIILGIVGLLMIWESLSRIFRPSPIEFGQALLVATIGLAVNLVSAWLLNVFPSQHRHDQGAMDGKSAAVTHQHHHDFNLRAAYLHVLADAFTSMTAIFALLSGIFLGWNWMDPVMGIVGAAVILVWCRGLLLDTGAALLDHGADAKLSEKVRAAIEAETDSRVVDLHIWQIAPGHDAVILSVIASQPKPPSHYRTLINEVRRFSHVTIEVHQRQQSSSETPSPIS